MPAWRYLIAPQARRGSLPRPAAARIQDRVGLASGSARSRRPACGPRVIAPRVPRRFSAYRRPESSRLSTFVLDWLGELSTAGAVMASSWAIIEKGPVKTGPRTQVVYHDQHGAACRRALLGGAAMRTRPVGTDAEDKARTTAVGGPQGGIVEHRSDAGSARS